MSYKKIQKQIKKISSLAESIAEDEEITSIERDLMLSYIRKLYEQVLDLDIDNPVAVKKSSKAAATEPEKVAEPVIEKVVERQPFERAPVERKPFERAPRPSEEVEAVAAPVSEPKVERQPFERAAKVEQIVVEPARVEPAAVIKNEEPKLSAEMKALFNKTDSRELSDKLSNMPIANLSKAFSINERIFTIQELFDGNQELFQSTVAAIDNASSYEDAQRILVDGVASSKGWDSEGKIKKAEIFIKKVQRRFA